MKESKVVSLSPRLEAVRRKVKAKAVVRKFGHASTTCKICLHEPDKTIKSTDTPGELQLRLDWRLGEQSGWVCECVVVGKMQGKPVVSLVNHL